MREVDSFTDSTKMAGNSFRCPEEYAVFSEEERRSMIYLLTFSAVKDLSVYQFQELFYVSKNTILKDVKGDQRGTCSFQDSTIVLENMAFI